MHKDKDIGWICTTCYNRCTKSYSNGYVVLTVNYNYRYFYNVTQGNTSVGPLAHKTTYSMNCGKNATNPIKTSYDY